LVVIVELLCDGTVSSYHGITVCARHPLVDELDREWFGCGLAERGAAERDRVQASAKSVRSGDVS